MVIQQTPTVKEAGTSLQEFELSINNSSTGKLLSLLSSSLYSDPLISFIRETVSNAYDSHIEAGQTELPIELNVDKDTKTIIVRDYGTGLSPQRIREIYSFVGGSTKSEDNTQIGGFGIGRLSGLAVSDIVHITSWYEGTKYSYILTRNADGISLKLIRTESEPESLNGVEVKVIASNSYMGIFAINDTIRFFPNVYFNHFDNYVTVDFENFSVSNTFDSSRLLVGGVVPYAYKHRYPGVAPHRSVNIKVPIGEVELSTSREDLIFSEKTNQAIERAYKRTCQELGDMVKERIGGKVSLQNFRKFINIMRHGFQGEALIDDMFAWLDYEFETECGYKFNIRELDKIMYGKIQNYAIKASGLRKHKDLTIYNLLDTCILYDPKEHKPAVNKMIRKKYEGRYSINPNDLKELCDTPFMKLFEQYAHENFIKPDTSRFTVNEGDIFGITMFSGEEVKMSPHISKPVILITDTEDKKIMRGVSARNVVFVKKKALKKLKELNDNYMTIQEFFEKNHDVVGMIKSYFQSYNFAYNSMFKQLIQTPEAFNDYLKLEEEYGWAHYFMDRFDVKPLKNKEMDAHLEKFEIALAFNLYTEIGRKIFLDYVNNK